MKDVLDYVIDLNQLGIKDVAKVGGKNASLGEMVSNLAKLGVKVPNGFATTTLAYKEFLDENGISTQIYQKLKNLDHRDLKQLARVSSGIKKLILHGSFNQNFVSIITQKYHKLIKHQDVSLAVRSSATAEDLGDASFAGQHDSILNIKGINNLITTIKEIYASLFNERAIIYRIQNNFPHEDVAISATLQIMARSDRGSSGVMFTLDTETGFDQVVFINASWGLGESVVQGAITPDEFFVYKPALKKNKNAILEKTLGNKTSKIIYGKGSRTITVHTTKKEQQTFSIDDSTITKLAKLALIIENHYKKPMDIEWAWDDKTKDIYIVQARPETVRSQKKQKIIKRYSLAKGNAPIITQGYSIGQKIGQGKACVISTHHQMDRMQDGQVLVADMTDPDWEPIMKKSSAMITNRGGRTCHAAIVARELGIPAVVGCKDATTKIKNHMPVTASCAGGEIGKVYQGILPIKIEEIVVDRMPKLPVKLLMNLAEPSKAFTYRSLPNDGVGLVRLEFIINNMIGIHPKALLQFDRMPTKIKDLIIQKTVAYQNPIEFYIEKIREGIATIAAAFFPKPIIVRFSDFKSNEYANLLGGNLFEPHEENPMIGFRGASRYVAEQFADCFFLECEAMKRVRNMGLVNTWLMLPFVRTTTEAKTLIDILAKNGLKRGKDGLKIMLMCEIPANVILAEEFLKLCDGFSIGSNDLTQLTLGIDRDSGLVAHIFDERNAAVKKLLQEVIKVCKKRHKYVGICGQAPSDHPEMAKWLMNEGIESLSLTPDTIIETWLYLAKQLGK